jgi:diguanylate cyclase (GGDEF)-like protein/PAS domain S-box-containing protein
MNEDLSAHLFERLLDASHDAAIVIDQYGAIRYLNPASQALTGFAFGEVAGKPLDGLLPEGLAEKHQGYILDYISRGTSPNVLGHVRDFAVRHRTGDMIPIQLKALDLGVIDGVRYFGAFMVDMREQRAEDARIAALMTQLEQQAMTDTLTALPNRRSFDAELARIAARARRNASPTSLGVADIDHFKSINDRYGHPVGDLVLCEVGKAIERAARGTDFVARTGGEEFGMLFPDTSTEMARLVAERMRKAVAESSVTTLEGECIRVTISIGLAAMPSDGVPEEALASADAALYQAKETGRDRVATADVGA